jgi:uncharacterized protein GlcG (DUF336 family)
MRSPIIFLAALSVTGAALAQTPAAAPAPPPVRAKGPPIATAMAVAQAALAACQAGGFKVSVLVVDSIGEPVVLLVDDGASPRTPAAARTKTATVIRYRLASGDVLARANADAALAAEIKADPAIGVARLGGLPILSGGEIVGALGVGGAPAGEKDEDCAKAGLAKVR